MTNAACLGEQRLGDMIILFLGAGDLGLAQPVGVALWGGIEGKETIVAALGLDYQNEEICLSFK